MISCPKCGKAFAGRSIGSHGPRCGVTPEELYWNLVQRGDGCWPWLGAKHRDGYGRANVVIDGKRQIRIAHRMAWYFTHGPVPADKDVCHSCDNRICCNPAHLFLAVHVENMHDMYRKERQPSKLKAKDVREIRRLLGDNPPKGMVKQVAQLYGVTDSSISAIKTGKKWRMVS